MDIVERLKGYDVDDLVGLKDMQEAADEIERLRDELDTWMSVFPDIAPESVLPDRSNLEKEIERLREALGTINAWYPISVSRPMDTVRDIMDFANKTLNGGGND
jgi:hypothetical protein